MRMDFIKEEEVRRAITKIKILASQRYVERKERQNSDEREIQRQLLLNGGVLFYDVESNRLRRVGIPKEGTICN